MTRWLQAARQATEPDFQPAHETRPDAAVMPENEVLSVKSVLSKGGSRNPAPPARADGLDPDAGAYLDRLHLYGPATYCAMASALGWGATRAWQAEARLRAAGLVVIDKAGKAVPFPMGEAKWRAWARV
ncbi:MAG: hypothetical protein Q7J57_06545, partial [Gemmobacter sp.]|nr:hypothetical protein [Gemmobacter sp.]